MQIYIEPLKASAAKEEVEFVESKGEGHPDSICDSVCEHCGKTLSEYYKKRFGKVLHYNIDKALLIAGKAEPKFNGGKLIDKIKLIIAGRVTDRAGGKKIPAKRIIKNAAKEYLKRFPAEFSVKVDVKKAAANLGQIAERHTAEENKAVANDTSFGAAHYPYSKTERLVLDATRHISSEEFRTKFPWAGQDVKVMGIRRKKKTELYIAMAFKSRFINGMEDYVRIKDFIAKHLMKKYKTAITINALDDITGDESKVYLTVTGLSAEMGDDGQVGRGNRYNGMITPGRVMSLEATAGKNWRHTGRAYQIIAHKIAKDIVKKTRVREADVKLVTNIGGDLRDPHTVHIRTKGKLSKKRAEEIVKKNMRKVKG